MEEVRFSVILDATTGMVRVEGPFDSMNRFQALALMECGKHELNQFYDQKESVIERVKTNLPRHFGRI